jgi:Bifunctional DNA primase/polymerase, N-terminal
MNETERQAHRYADNGWPVFPAAPGSKLPLTQHGFLDASSSHRRIETWWGTHPAANVAIATGRPGPDVLDIDVHADGSGWAALNELKRAGLVREPDAVVRTPSTGAHFYYAGSDQRNGHLPDQHLDYRAQGGYVVAPPSQVDGKLYTVVKHQPIAATFDWQAARDHLSPEPKPSPSPSPSLNAQKSLPGGARDVRHLVPWLEVQQEGNRNAGLFWAANRAVEANDNATLGQLAKAAESLGLGRREVDRTIASAQRPEVPQRGPGIEHQGQQEASAEVREPDRPFERPVPVPARDEPQKEREAEAG